MSFLNLQKCDRNHQDANNGNHTATSQSQHASATASDTLTSEAATPDPCDLEGGVRRREGSVMGEELVYRLQELARQGSLSDAFIAGGDDEGLHPGTEEEEGEEVEVEEEEDEGGRCSHDGDEDGTRSENAFQEGEMDWIYQRSEKDHGEEEQEEEEQEQEQEEEEEEEEMKREYNRCLIASQPRVSFSSPSHPELNGACKSEGGWVTGGGESEQEEAEEEEEEKEEVPGRNGQIAEEQKE